MTVSADYLIHFTRSLDNLKSIIKSGFKITLCEEIIVFENKETNLLVPMVSFCDIPLSQIIKHTEQYGEYGIGLTREWGKREKLCPIIYIVEKTSAALAIRSLIWSSVNFINSKITSNQELKEKFISPSRIASFVKNYECLVKNDRYIEGYKFYDEREWRFVPIEFDNQPILPHYIPDHGVTDIARRMLSKVKLSIKQSDIKYLIVKNDNEVAELVSFINLLSNYGEKEKALLMTRTMTCEQIRNDI